MYLFIIHTCNLHFPGPLINTKASSCAITVPSTCHQVITTSRPITSSSITPKSSLPSTIVKKSGKNNPTTNLIRTTSTPLLNKIHTTTDKSAKIHRSFSKVELKGKNYKSFLKAFIKKNRKWVQGIFGLFTGILMYVGS